MAAYNQLKPNDSISHVIKIHDSGNSGVIDEASNQVSSKNVSIWSDDKGQTKISSTKKKINFGCFDVKKRHLRLRVLVE